MKNVYAQSVAGMNGRVASYLEFLDHNGQVDRDEDGDPIVTRIDKLPPSNWRVFFVRNGYEENFIINPRKRANANGVVDPIRKTWNFDDGYRRSDPMRQRVLTEPPDSRGERPRRDYSHMVAELIDPDAVV